jgi:hypothetical protein
VATTPVKPIIVGFYGADTPFTFPNGFRYPDGSPAGGGNQTMMRIGNTLLGEGFQAKTFTSLAWESAYQWLLSNLDLNGDGKYDPSDGDEQRPIEIYGHSWGGITALQLAQNINTSASFVDKDISVVATIDPVTILRFTSGWVPGNVNFFWNRYQTDNTDINILGLIAPRGKENITRLRARVRPRGPEHNRGYWACN